MFVRLQTRSYSQVYPDDSYTLTLSRHHSNDVKKYQQVLGFTCWAGGLSNGFMMGYILFGNFLPEVIYRDFLIFFISILQKYMVARNFAKLYICHRGLRRQGSYRCAAWRHGLWPTGKGTYRRGPWR
jgi:hypothetical protein